jgi:hypothetical protein
VPGHLFIQGSSFELQAGDRAQSLVVALQRGIAFIGQDGGVASAYLGERLPMLGTLEQSGRIGANQTLERGLCIQQHERIAGGIAAFFLEHLPGEMAVRIGRHDDHRLVRTKNNAEKAGQFIEECSLVGVEANRMAKFRLRQICSRHAYGENTWHRWQHEFGAKRLQ